MSRKDRVKVEIFLVWLDDEESRLMAEIVEGPFLGAFLDTGLTEQTLHEHVPKRFRRRLVDDEVVTWLAKAPLVDSWLRAGGFKEEGDK